MLLDMYPMCIQYHVPKIQIGEKNDEADRAQSSALSIGLISSVKEAVARNDSTRARSAAV